MGILRSVERTQSDYGDNEISVLSTYVTAYFISFFLVSYVGERPWWPMQSPNKGRKKKVKG